MELSVSGITEEDQKIKRLSGDIQNISGKVQLSDLFTADFMNKHTKFESIGDLLNDCGFVLTSPNDFEKVTSGALDGEISSRTEFSGWEEMRTRAVQEYIAKKLNG